MLRTAASSSASMSAASACARAAAFPPVEVRAAPLLPQRRRMGRDGGTGSNALAASGAPRPARLDAGDGGRGALR